jgi:uncharacterized membrane protein YuzA (DUF378 family)
MEQPTTVAEAGPPARPRYRRNLRNYLLDAGLQLRFASYLVGIAGLISAFLGWRLWLSYGEASRLVALGDPVADEAIAHLLAREDRVRMVWLAVGLAAVVLCLLVFAVVVTHKVAGPALVIGRTCRLVGEGELKRPRPLRRGDLLTNLADEVAGMVDALRVREQREREALRELAEALAEGPPGAERAREVLQRLDAEKAARLGS